MGSHLASEPAIDVDGVLSGPWFLSCSSEVSSPLLSVSSS